MSVGRKKLCSRLLSVITHNKAFAAKPSRDLLLKKIMGYNLKTIGVEKAGLK